MNCPECDTELKYTEGAFMNELGEPEWCGLVCPECNWTEEDM